VFLRFFLGIFKILEFFGDGMCGSGRPANPLILLGNLLPDPRRGEGGVRSKRALRSLAKASFYFNGAPIHRHRRLKAPQARPFGPRALSFQAKLRQSLRVLGCRSGKAQRPCAL